MDEKLTINELKVMSVLLHKECYGLEIIKTVKEEANTTLYLGTLYNLLSRLERKGYVKSRWGENESERGGNRRRYYRLTGLGERVLKAELNSLNSLSKLTAKPLFV